MERYRAQKHLDEGGSPEEAERMLLDELREATEREAACGRELAAAHRQLEGAVEAERKRIGDDLNARILKGDSSWSPSFVAGLELALAIVRGR